MQYVKGATWHWVPDMTDDVIVYKSTGNMDAYGKRALNTTGTTTSANNNAHRLILTAPAICWSINYNFFLTTTMSNTLP